MSKEDVWKSTVMSGVTFPTIPYKGDFLNHWAILNGVLADISDRRGLKQAFVDYEPNWDMVEELMLNIKIAVSLANLRGGEWSQNLAKKFLSIISDHNRKFEKELGDVPSDTLESMLESWAGIIEIAATLEDRELSVRRILQREFMRRLEVSMDQFEGTMGYDLEACRWAKKGQLSVLQVLEEHYKLLQTRDQTETDLSLHLTETEQ